VSDDYSCLACGACCLADYADVSYVSVSEQDYDQLTPHEQETLVHTDHVGLIRRRSLRTASRASDCRCIALRGNVGSEVTCSIYERRPGVCRRFEPGGTACSLARRPVFGSER
jgi:Fe-S-cluster containining protein